MTKGFIIYAIGHRNYYHMAEALAASLLYNADLHKEPVYISLLCDDPTRVQERALFDQVKELDISKYMVDGHLVFNKATICMYDHSPYSVTIKLDADMIWLNGRNPSQIFRDLEAHDLVHMNRGHGWGQGNSVWTAEENLQAAYDFTDDYKLYKIYGEFVYFRKCDAVKKYFRRVKQIFNAPKVEMTEGFSNGTFTDELAFQIATMEQGFEYPDNYTPIMNKYLGYRAHEFTYAYQLPATFYAYSIGGNQTPSFMKEQYNLLASHYYHQLGLQNPYQVRDKKYFLPERLKR